MPALSKITITEATIRKLRPGGRQMDAKLIGFGVRKSPKTRRVAFFIRRVINGVDKTETIGIHPKLSVREARRVAHRSIAKVEQEFSECKQCKHAPVPDYESGKLAHRPSGAASESDKLDQILLLVSPNRPTVTVRELIEKISPGWLAPLKSGSQSALRRYFALINAEWGDVPAAEIKNGAMVRWHEKLAKRGPVQAESACRSLILLLKKAAEQDLLTNVPTFRVPYAKKRKRLPVTRNTVKRFVSALESVLAAPVLGTDQSCAKAIIMILNSGERASAACSLHRSEVDYKKKVIVKSRKLDKTVQIPASDFLIQFLRSIEHPCGYYFPNTKYTNGINYQVLRTFLKRICVEHKILDSGGRRPTLHSFRHTYASMLAEKGLPVPHIQRLLGHTALKSTLRYIHAVGPEVYASANALDIARIKLDPPSE